MQSPLDLIPTVTRDELRKAKIAQDKAEKSAEVNLLDQVLMMGPVVLLVFCVRSTDLRYKYTHVKWGLFSWSLKV